MSATALVYEAVAETYRGVIHYLRLLIREQILVAAVRSLSTSDWYLFDAPAIRPSGRFSRGRRRIGMEMLILCMLMVAMQPQTYINEFPHPRMVIHFHPTTQQFKLDDLKFALDHNVNAVELDLHLRGEEVVCNHDSATPESPTLRQALDMIFRKKPHDGFQFFIVLEPKENSGALFEAILKVLGDYRTHLSTSSERLNRPRGVTIVITGAYPRQFYAHFPKEAVNRLCIVEGHDFTGEITDLSGQRFQWVSIKHSKKLGEDARRVRALHDGTDPAIPGKFNVRIWDCHADIKDSLTSGADSLNCDRDELDEFQHLLEKK